MINTNSIMIRLEKKEEYREVEKMVRESFWNVYRPGCFEHYVLNQLRDDPAFVPELDFVMEQNGNLIGQNMFMRANIKADDGRTISIMTMGPICITPELKRKGYGKILLDYSLEKAKELGFVDSILYGDKEDEDKAEGMIFSSVAVTNSLLDKLRPEKKDTRVDAGQLQKRLSFLM